jgi:hypothetical protein
MGNGTAISAAVANTDYLTPTGSGGGLSGVVYSVNGAGGTVTQDQVTGLSSTGIVKRTGANTLAIATPATDYIAGGVGSSTQVAYFTGSGVLAGHANLTYVGGTGLTISDTTEASPSSVGALVVSGGVSILKNFYIGGSPVCYAASGVTATYYLNGATQPRWGFRKNSTAESGGNAGSNFELQAWTDAGGLIDNPITITRVSAGTITLGGSTNRPVSTTGALTVGNTATINGSVAATSTTTGTLKVTGGLGVSGAIYGGGDIRSVSASSQFYCDSALGGNAAYFANATSGTGKYFIMRTGNSNRWLLGSDTTAESGANAGSPFVLKAYTDAAADIDTPITIVRASGGLMTFTRPTSHTSTTASTSRSTGALLLVGGLGSDITSTATSGSEYGVNLRILHAPSGASTAAPIAGQFTASSSGANAPSQLIGVYGGASNSASAGTVTNVFAHRAIASNLSTGTVTNAYGYYVDAIVNSGGGSIGTAYGMRISDINVGSANYALYTGAGLVRIGDTTASTSTSTGALILLGGAGVSGNVYTGGYVISSTTDTSTSGSVISHQGKMSANPASASSGVMIGVYGIAELNTSCSQNMTSSTGGLQGVLGQVDVFGSGTVTYAAAVRGVASHRNATGQTTNMAGGEFTVQNIAAGTINTGYGVRIRSASNSGTFGTMYGLYVDSQTAASTNYAIYTNSGAVRFGGVVTAADTTDATSLTAAALITSGGAAVTKSLMVGNHLVLPKTTNYGIKVDNTTPTFPWHDLIGDVTPKTTGAGTPTFGTYNGNINGWKFVANDIVDLVFHVPHDYVPGTDIYLHVHWSHNGTAITGNVVFTHYSTYAKGHNQAVFPAEVTSTITYNTTNIATTPQYQHRIDEIALSTAGGSAALLNTTNLEVDGVILIRLKVTTLPTITAGNLFIHTCDLHYQSTCIGTKAKAPNFYT